MVPPSCFVAALPVSSSSLHLRSSAHLTSLARRVRPRRNRVQPSRPLPATMTQGSPAKRILVAVANGSEEIETACAVDTFVRAGADVTLASVEPSTTVTMSRGMRYVADTLIDDVSSPFDAICLPGGMPGAERLRDSAALTTLLKQHTGVLAAVCAAPAVVLAHHGLLEGKTATCYPNDAFTGKIEKIKDTDVVQDGNVITGSGPGTSLRWALRVVAALYGQDKADEIGGQMLAL